MSTGTPALRLLSREKSVHVLFKNPLPLIRRPTTAILIRARSVVQVHPGPPFKSVSCTKTSTHNPTHNSLHHRTAHTKCRKIVALRRPCFIAVFLRIQIERRLDFCVTQDSLNGFWINFRLVHQPVAECCLNGFTRWPFRDVGDSVLYHSLPALASQQHVLGAFVRDAALSCE